MRQEERIRARDFRVSHWMSRGCVFCNKEMKGWKCRGCIGLSGFERVSKRVGLTKREWNRS